MKNLNIKNMKKAMKSCCRLCLSKKTKIPVQRIDQFLDESLFPSPYELLRIGVTLGLDYSKLVIDNSPSTIIIQIGRTK